MNKYLPLNLKWCFFTKEGDSQWKSLFYRIYINFFGIFLGIKLLPLSIQEYGVWFFYKEDEVCYKYSWKRKNKNDKWISLEFSGTGEFGDMIYPTLKSMDKAWKEYFDDCIIISEKEDGLYKYREKNDLCNEVFCNIEEEHKKHND